MLQAEQIKFLTFYETIKIEPLIINPAAKCKIYKVGLTRTASPAKSSRTIFIGI